MILSIGCGNRQVNKHSLGIDFNVPKWSEKYSERFILGDVKNLPFKDGVFENVVCKHIFEHFSRYDRERDYVLQEWWRVLKVNGLLKIVVPNSQCYAKLLIDNIWDIDKFSFMVFGSQTDKGQFHFVAYNKESLIRYVEKTLGKNKIELKEASFGGGYMGFSRFKDFEVRAVFRKI